MLETVPAGPDLLAGPAVGPALGAVAGPVPEVKEVPTGVDRIDDAVSAGYDVGELTPAGRDLLAFPVVDPTIGAGYTVRALSRYHSSPPEALTA